MSISPGEYEILMQRVKGNTYRKPAAPSPELMRALNILANLPLYKKSKARGSHVTGQMNKTEAKYAEHLELRKMAGEIKAYWFEAMTFKIGPDCRYTPDMVVQMADGSIECHEVKGTRKDKSGKEHAHVEEDARVKMRVAAGMFPFRFAIIWFSLGRGWVEVEL